MKPREFLKRMRDLAELTELRIDAPMAAVGRASLALLDRAEAVTADSLVAQLRADAAAAADPKERERIAAAISALDRR